MSDGAACYWDSDCASFCCNNLCSAPDICGIARNYPRTLYQPCMESNDCQSNCCDSLSFTCSASACQNQGKTLSLYIIIFLLSLVLLLLIWFTLKRNCLKKAIAVDSDNKRLKWVFNEA